MFLPLTILLSVAKDYYGAFTSLLSVINSTSTLIKSAAENGNSVNYNTGEKYCFIMVITIQRLQELLHHSLFQNQVTIAKKN